MKLLLTCILMQVSTFVLYAQDKNWQHLDLQTDHIFGISSNKAYAELLKGKKGKKVIVGIVDTGIDTLHEDLKPILWTDVKTGIHGWNYIGQETGQEDVTHLVGEKKTLYDSLSYTAVPEQYQSGYQQYRKLTPGFDAKRDAIKALILALKDVKTHQADSLLALAQYHLQHGLNVKNSENDNAIGDANISPDVIAPIANAITSSVHGTHVAGIIAGVRNNGKGPDGIADQVEIMMFKANGNIRELRDKALADAIRFAVDHGAKIINMSFGKPYTWNKQAVDAAVKYAMAKDVLLIHAAGNSGNDLDNEEHYPNPVYLRDSGVAPAWIEVGASGPKDDKSLPLNFSNYGAKSVDVFAPGYKIYSTIPGNQYDSLSGTSMAAPVVTGIAALIREYYPKLTAVEVKDIIMKTVVKRDVLKDKCVSGGVVNAYNALKLAETYK